MNSQEFIEGVLIAFVIDGRLIKSVDYHQFGLDYPVRISSRLSLFILMPEEL